MSDDDHTETERTTGFVRQRNPWTFDRQFVPRPPVRWMALGELARTGLHAVVSKTFGQYSDRREMFAYPQRRAGEPPTPPYFDHRTELTSVDGSPDDPYWFDYVADLGDGFAATYAVAEQLGAKHVVLAEPPAAAVGDSASEPEPTVLPRGRLLVMGGDEIYPLAVGAPERDAYLDRTAGPYEAALQHLEWPGGKPDDPVLHLYAIPGNHDWYDSLGGFVKQFCSGQWIGAWQTRQDRSYFAIRLPHGWWLWGIDVAFEGPMDDPQLRYFQAAAKLVDEEDGRVILCTAYPRWFEAGGGHDGAYSVIRGFVHKTFGDDSPRVRLMLSGDKHVYARYSPTAPDAPGGEESVKIASGGGGAYLSGTQDLEQRISVRERRSSTMATEYALASVWPEPRVARGRIALRAFLRVWRHWSFSLVIALLYLLLATIMRLSAVHGLDTVNAIRQIGHLPWSEGLHRMAEAAIKSTAFWIFAVALWMALSGTALAWQRGDKLAQPRAHWLWGLGHAAAHLAAVCVVTTTAMWFAFSLSDGKGWGLAVYYVTVLVLGYVVGTSVYVCYLVLAQLRRRSVWALVALLAEQDWKNFLRIRVEEHQITVYALGLEHVPRPRTATWDADGRLTVSAGKSVWKLIDRVTVPRT